VDWKGPTKIFFSPDGRYIAYDLSVNENTGERNIFVMATDGSRETVAVAHPSVNTIMGWSPDGMLLLFASDRSGSTGLWALPLADGKPQGDARLVKTDVGSSWSLGSTTSGTMYVWKDASPTYVQVAPIDLTVGKLLPSPTGTVQRFIGSRGRPDWSSDGKHLAYSSCAPLGGGPCTLFIRSAETGQVRELRPRLAYFFFPRWSPDGRSFVTNGKDLKGRGGIYRIDAQTGEVSIITVSRRGSPQWAADGKSIYYRLFVDHALVIAERDLATGTERELLRAAIEGANGCSVSPDGRYAATISISPDLQTKTLLVIPFAGGDARPLLRTSSSEELYGAQAMDPAWTPDSRALIIAKGLGADTERKELWLVPIDSGKPRKLDIDMDNWILPGGGFRLAPDGRQIAFVGAAGKPGQEIWALENFLPKLSAKK
jgi:Tol biopolymer transport system component